MFLISQVESIGYLKNVDVNENLENSVSILFRIKSIKPLYYPHSIHKTMIYLLWRFYHDFNNVLVSLFLVKKKQKEKLSQPLPVKQGRPQRILMTDYIISLEYGFFSRVFYVVCRWQSGECVSSANNKLKGLKLN